jgi:hypothetical protein
MGGEGGSVWVGLVIDTVYPRAAVFLRKRRGLALAVMPAAVGWLRAESRRTGERFLPQRASFLR